MRLFKISTVIFSLILGLSLSANLFSQTTKKKPTKKPKTTPAQTAANTTLTNDEVTGGLKEALSRGVKFAVDTLGRDNGFLDDVRVKIPLPSSLQKVEKGLRLVGQGKTVDEFVASMNHAAEKAVPVAIDVFVDAIKQMTFTDAKNILFSGQQDAATQFFRRTSEETLRGKFRPIVERFTGEVGVTQKYKNMMGKYSFAGKLLGQDATDIDGYVTQKALDGLFFMVAEEEKKIRKDPIGTGVSIIQKVFGAIFKR